MDRSELLDLIPAYALEALEPDEKRQVEALLMTDAEAQQILAEYQDITTNLILATPARRAPAHLQNDLRQRLAANRTQGQVAISTPARPASRRMSIWVPLLAAAAVIAIVFGVIAYLNRNPAEDLYHKIEAMPGHKTMPIPSGDPNAPAGEMVASPDGTQAVIRMTRMPTLQSDHTFQLWLINDNGPQSGGLFAFKQPDATYYVVVPLDAKNVLDYKAYGVSVEPSGGSKTPSTTPIVVISTT
jgi:anti-sigma-K factor RskA